MQTDSMREQLVTQAILALQGSLYRLAFSYVHDPDEAMDLVQECAYRALKNRARLRDGDGENISATVRGRSFPWLRYLLTMPSLCKVGRERLPAFFVTKFRQMPHIVQNIFQEERTWTSAI